MKLLIVEKSRDNLKPPQELNKISIDSYYIFVLAIYTSGSSGSGFLILRVRIVCQARDHYVIFVAVVLYQPRPSIVV